MCTAFPSCYFREVCSRIVIRVERVPAWGGPQTSMTGTIKRAAPAVFPARQRCEAVGNKRHGVRRRAETRNGKRDDRRVVSSAGDISSQTADPSRYVPSITLYPPIRYTGPESQPRWFLQFQMKWTAVRRHKIRRTDGHTAGGGKEIHRVPSPHRPHPQPGVSHPGQYLIGGVGIFVVC